MKTTFLILLCLQLTLALEVEDTNSEQKVQEHPGDGHHDGVHLYSWRWNETFYGKDSKFSRPVMITGLIMFAVIFKIVFHHMSFLEKLLPESCVLILVGICFGLFITFALSGKDNPFPVFTANLFFNMLLPPIIFDAAISLYNKEFFDTFYSVIIFAVFGTLFNVFTIGPSLYLFSQVGALGSFEFSENTTMLDELPASHELGLLHCLTFASLISAVDPVAVLAIFEQIEVNAGLYFLVFGESLFNDGVTVVLYNSMNTLAVLPSVGGHDILMAILSFFTVVLGGTSIGVLHGLFVTVITRFTKHVRIVEPLVILICAYSAFLWAELFHWSGIISIIGYGITAKHYAFQNISQKSFTTVKYSVKTMASTSDCVIFLFLGMSIFTEKHYYHPGFIIATILLCLLFRLLSTFIFSALVNLKRMDKISFHEQIIMTWGGLRGAVGFSLAMVLKEGLWYRELFLTTALVMVLFTVFLQGGTIKLLVKILKIELEDSADGLIGVEVQDKVMGDISQGMIAVCGNIGTRGRLAKVLRKWDKNIKKILIHDESKTQLQRKFERISVRDHFTNLYAPRLIAENHETGDKSSVPVEITNDTRKIFRKGMKNSHWSKLQNSSAEGSGTTRARNMMLELDRRHKNATEMGREALDLKLGPIREEEKDLLLEGSPRISDDVISTLKAHYLTVQQTKKPIGRRLATLSSSHL